MNYINIDFSNKKDSIEDFDSITLKVESKKFLLGLIKKEIDIKYHLIKVENIKLSSDVSLEDESQLILLKNTSDSSATYLPELSNIKINTERTEIKIAFNTSQILDYLSDTSYKEMLSFDVVVFPTSNHEGYRKHFEVELVFLRASSDIIIDFDKSDSILNGMEHKKDNKIYMGDFKVQCISNYNFSEPVDWSKVTVYTKKDDFDDDIFWGDDISLSNKSIIVDAIEKYEVNLKRILPNTNVSIPIYADLSQDESPLNEILEKIYFSIEFSIKNITYHKSHEFEYSLLPDRRSTALMGMISQGDDFVKLTSNKILLSKFQWAGRDAKGKVNCFTLRFGNYAESGDGKVEIKNFTPSLKYDTKTTSVVFDSKVDFVEKIDTVEKYEDVLSRVIKINDKSISKLPKDFVFKNSKDSYQDLSFSFRHDSIDDIPEDVASVVLNISFEYRTSDEEKFKVFESRILFKLEKDLGDSWLALDFGTSASVAAFADGELLETSRDNPEKLLINLQKGLENLVSGYKHKSIPEKGTQFLSSEMMLRQGTKKTPVYLESTSYNDDVLYISPNRDIQKQNIWASIPYLKSLIGVEYLPDFSGKIAANNYAYHNSPGDKLKRFEDQPIRVESILQSNYNIMLRDFVLKNVKNEEDLNKIILTIPNVFTPKHIDSIRKIVDERFPNIRKDYINFISESDAVAIYYHGNWDDLNYNREDIDRFNYDDEYVLVYDIGAGTTDITYFKISKSDVSVEKEIEIIGKFGKNTAGNYLDYVIAMVLEIEKPDHATYSYFGTQKSLEEERLSAKEFIQDIIKPRLNDSYTFFIDPANGLIVDENDNRRQDNYIEFNTDTIIQHPFMDQYLKENSSDLFDKFFSLFNRLDFSHDNSLQKGEFPINTVIFSGRTIMFEKLKDRVENELKEWSRDFDTYFIKDISQSKLKSVVALGALEYAMKYRDPAFSTVKIKNRNLYARYGFLYKDVKNSNAWVFKELLNPSVTPVNSKPNVVDGLTIYEYDTDKYNALPKGETTYLDLRETATGFFVQSFSDDTARDAYEGNWQYISRMFNFGRKVSTPSQINKVKAHIKVNHLNEMIVSIGNYENDPEAPLKIDINDSETFKKSMWPYYSDK